MLQLDKTVDLSPRPASDRLLVAELHYTHGNDFVEVDVQDDQGRARRLKVQLSGAQQAQLESRIEAVVNASLNVTATKVPDPTP